MYIIVYLHEIVQHDDKTDKRYMNIAYIYIYWKDHLSRKTDENGGDSQLMKLLMMNGFDGDGMVVDVYHRPSS